MLARILGGAHLSFGCYGAVRKGSFESACFRSGADALGAVCSASTIIPVRVFQTTFGELRADFKGDRSEKKFERPNRLRQYGWRFCVRRSAEKIAEPEGSE